MESASLSHGMRSADESIIVHEAPSVRYGLVDWQKTIDERLL